MLRSGLITALAAGSLAITLAGPAAGQDDPASPSVSKVALPGGLRAAMAAVGDDTSPDRARFLAEFISRTYDTPRGARTDVREPALRSLIERLNAGGSLDDTIPLPLSSTFWLDVVFHGKTTPRDLLTSLLQSRGAALFYYGLLSLDDDTRVWIAGQPSLVSEIVAKRPGAFVVASPGLRVEAGRIRMPGGASAEPVWQALVGHRGTEPVEFTRALLGANGGLLAYFFGEMSHLTARQIRLALNLENADVAVRVAAGRRLLSAFERVWNGRAIELRVFTRPPYDPALLAADVDASLHSGIPGTRDFWRAVFDQQDHTKVGRASERSAPAPTRWDDPADFSWLCEQVFDGELALLRRRYMTVLFAVRHAPGIRKDTASDALEAVRASATYPALVAALERAGITDLSVFAQAARRAAALNAIEDSGRASRALAQFQGAVAMITRAAVRGTLTPAAASRLASTLAAIPVNPRGDYDGRVATWLAAWLTARPASRTSSSDDVYDGVSGPLDEDALRVLAGPSPDAARVVDWEGTRYRVDLSHAAALKLLRARGPSPRPYLTAASAVMAIAEALTDPALTRDALQLLADSLARVWRADTDDPNDEPAGDVALRVRDALSSLQRASRANDLKAATRAAPALKLLADDLAARGLMEWTYAAALGPRDGITLSAADAAARHDFGFHAGAAWRSQAWRLPEAGPDATQVWRVAGSLLGLDVTLANFSLVSLSSKPPARRPTLNEADRRVFIESVALAEPRLLIDSDRDAIVDAIRNGRARLDAVRSPADAFRVADEIGLSPLSRTLLAWTAANDPDRTSRFLSHSELFWLGTAGAIPDSLTAWGMPAESRLGCLCLQIVDRRPWDMFAGRWSTGMTASAFPDLNLHLAELLAELHMPAALLAPVLTAAILEFVNTVPSRDPDDRRAMSEFVQSLRSDRLELYLALLTTDGPLVPLGDTPAGKGSADFARSRLPTRFTQ